MKHLWKSLQMVCRCDRGSFWRRALYVLLGSLLPLANLFLLKRLVDAVSAGEGAFLPWLLAMCGVFLLQRVVSILDGVNSDVLSQRLIDHVNQAIQTQAARLDMAYYDNPSYHDTLHRAQQEASSRPVQVFSSIMSLFASAVTIVGIVVILASASWWVLPVMFVAVVPSFVVRLSKSRIVYRFRRQNTPLFRLSSYLAAVLTRREFAKELRAFRAEPFFRSRYTRTRSRLTSRIVAISRRLGAYSLLCAVVEAAAMLLVVALLAARTASGIFSVGTFVMLFEAFRRGLGALTSLVASLSSLYDNRLFLSNLFEFLSLEPTVVSPPDPLPVPSDISSIQFCDVVFRYPGMERDVLSHFNFTARRGEITPLEGHNGIGKSTVINLLLRFYDPQQGRILLNGTDIRRFDLHSLRASMSVLFQDFGRYFITVDENITLSDRPHTSHIADPLLSFVPSLPKGYDSPLGRLFDQGSELSMGQWQRLAIARALDSPAPLLLLDEPAAWLDADSRQTLLSILEAEKPNRIIILITHR